MQKLAFPRLLCWEVVLLAPDVITLLPWPTTSQHWALVRQHDCP